MRLVYFAWVRERVGRTDEDVDLPEGIATVAELPPSSANASTVSTGPNDSSVTTDIPAEQRSSTVGR